MTRIRVWLVASCGSLTLALVGFVVVVGMAAGEYTCFDRHPWWGPPEDPNSTCSGLWYADKHPGEFPWTLQQ
jgi:hypothetical protein